jgi:hypothetical protein
MELPRAGGLASENRLVWQASLPRPARFVGKLDKALPLATAAPVKNAGFQRFVEFGTGHA